MPTEDLVSAELHRLVSKLRTAGAGRLAAPAAGWPTRAEAVRHLIAELVDIAGPEHGYPPVLADLVLGDQLAVVGRDALPSVAAQPALAGFVLGELVLHRWHLDGSLPSGATAASLGGDADLVQRLLARCPAERERSRGSGASREPG